MKRYLALFIVIMLGIQVSSAQQIIRRDPLISSMVGEISHDSIEAYIQKLVSFHTRHNLSVQDDPDIGIGAAWNWVKKEFEKYVPGSGARLSVEFVNYTVGGEGQRMEKETELRNVIATLKGTNPEDDRVLLISAHLDSRVEDNFDSTTFAPGANDDGSGVAAIMELVRIMSAHEFPVTIKYMILTGEEQGLFGASAMADIASEENWNIVALLNNDMIGNSGSSGTLLNDNMRVRVFSEGVPAFETEQMARMRSYTAGENDGNARQLARYIKEVGERYVDQLDVTLVYRNDRYGRGGDHTPFCRKGFTAVRICEFNENYHRTHTTPGERDGIMYGDLPEGVDYEYVRKNAGINLATLANLALSPGQPVNAGIVVSGLSNSTTLRWEKPETGKEPAGYYILMRETHQSMWQKKLFVTDTEVTLPYSKDNYFFSVQSVDSEGHESLPVFPGPARRIR
ncbi:MAG: M28 family metallopeptidase [Bacteroidales bacterium]|nr:M28 family metallopeptidase [Bacteroidales bacterium]